MVSNPDSWTDATMKGAGNTDAAKKKKKKKTTAKPKAGKSWSY
jgi:hypothetical protein